MSWLPIVCIAIIVLLGLIGLKLGVVKMLYHLASFALALILTALIAPPIAKTIVKTPSPRMDRAKQKVIDVLHLDEVDFEQTLSKDVLDKIDLPESIRDEIFVFNTREEYESIGVDGAKDYLATSIATIVMQALVYLVVFVLVWLIVFLIFQTLNLVAKVPGLAMVNRLAGMAVGFLIGACVIFLLFVLVTALASMPVGQDMLAQIDKNPVLRFWYDNNPLNGGFVYLSSLKK